MEQVVSLCRLQVLVGLGILIGHGTEETDTNIMIIKRDGSCKNYKYIVTLEKGRRNFCRLIYPNHSTSIKSKRKTKKKKDLFNCSHDFARKFSAPLNLTYLTRQQPFQTGPASCLDLTPSHSKTVPTLWSLL